MFQEQPDLEQRFAGPHLGEVATSALVPQRRVLLDV